MAITKKCKFKTCKNPRSGRETFCNSHRKKVTIARFLSELYRGMNRRTRGKGTKRPDLYKGLPIMPKEVFFGWAQNHPHFLKLYKQWVNCNFDRKLTPTINRMRSQGGYTLDNVEWLTNSQNCGLSGAVLKMKAKKEIYELLGVKINAQK